MCRFKSGIILKDRVFIPDYDSHTDMLEELKIADTEDNAKRLFVRAELMPPDNDVFTPVTSWKYHVDQDILPDWYVAEVDEMRMREAVTAWAKEHIHIGEKIERIGSGTHWIKDCKVEYICEYAKVEYIRGSAEVENICGSAEVKYICDSAKIKNICEYAKVEYIRGSAEVEYIRGSAEVEYIRGSAEVKYICDSAKIKNICEYAKVEYIRGSAEVEYIRGSAIIETAKYCTWEHIKSVCIKDEAVLIDRYNNKIYHSGAFETVIAGGQKDE